MTPTDRVEVLPGGVANEGLVVRIGETVRRPASAQSPAIAALLDHLRATGFDGAPVVVGGDEEGRDVYEWIAGDVAAAAPYPSWWETDDALASVGRLLRRFHDATRSFEPEGLPWSEELHDADGGPVVCHNDVCPENVVFREGEAFALLDFDFVAPGRAVWDVARAAGMCVPLREAAAPECFRRLGAFTRAYGLAPDEQESFVDVLIGVRRQGSRFVRARADRGEQAFVEMWARGGEAALAASLAWLEESRAEITAAVRTG